MQVTFLHPDLGIGGAERLIVDAAVALKQKGHSVKLVTNQYDPSHAFSECADLDITSVVQWLPRSLFGVARAAAAYLRLMIAAVYVCATSKPDVIIVDQISAALIVLRLFSSARLVFYCHYPDLLLTDRVTTAKRLYRSVIDTVEEKSIGLADVICVNSKFTASVVRLTFPGLAARHLAVIYPSLNTHYFDATEGRRPDKIEGDAAHLFVSLNRFEHKKDVGLAVDAFVEISRRLQPSEYARCKLVIAGGYDKRNEENAEVYRKLRDYALECGLSNRQHVFLQSPTDEEKVWLLRSARAILYTPTGEHFGIVPVEAMYSGTPVIAVKSGGPMESIDDGTTGFLCERSKEAFAEAMLKLVHDVNLRTSMSVAGPERVKRLFAFDAFANQLDETIRG